MVQHLSAHLETENRVFNLCASCQVFKPIAETQVDAELFAPTNPAARGMRVTKTVS